MIVELTNFEEKAKKVIVHAKDDIATLRSGKAAAQMLDPVRVEAYGSIMKINELAAISVPDINLLVVKPWDGSMIEVIEKAIASADLNLNPVVDGDMIRISVPPLTQERRQEMVKLLSKKIESYKVMLRSIRTNIKKNIEALKGTQNISKDDIHQYLEKLNQLTQQYISRLDTMAELKEKELMTV
jgi:ribosome recycling factor